MGRLNITNDEIMDICPTFSTWLDVVLVNENLNGSALARKIDMRPGTINLWREGRLRPGNKALKKLSEVLHVDIEKLTYCYF